jgi:hypothetical protein
MDKIEVGSIVRPKAGNLDVLTCGEGMYESAIVINLLPFIVVSHCTTMMWSFAMDIDDFEYIGSATEDKILKCMRRNEAIKVAYLRELNINKIVND